MTMPTTAPLSSGSGSLNGIAAQVSFPSISSSHAMCRSSSSVDTRVSGARRRLVEDALEHLRFDRAIGCGRYVSARFCQFGVASIVEAGSAAAHLFEPGVEIAGWYRLDDETHPGKTVAAEHCRKAGKLARMVGEKVEM